MPVKVDMSGLERIKKNMEKLSGKHQLSVSELMPDSFVAKQTDYPSFDAMLEAAGVEDPSEIRGETFSQFVAEHSKFASWDEMVEQAYAEYFERTLTK